METPKGAITKKKYEWITSHTARRSFATNSYLEGLDNYSIMKITGHKTEADFLKYIKVTEQEIASNIAKHKVFTNPFGTKLRKVN